jgi:pimeloyl-ACP methyl ester carboxylesterase
VHAAGTPGFRDALDALLDYDFRPRLPEIACPTLIVWGREDMLVPVEDADEFERRIPNARKMLMEDTGHVPMLERPVKFNDSLIEFLAEPRETVRDEAEATV